MLTVYNKKDLLPLTGDSRLSLPEGEGMLVSAVTGDGLDRLVSEILHHVSPVRV